MIEDHDDSSRGSPESHASGRRRVDWIFLAILLIAGVLRLHNLTETSIWVDEANSILTAKQPGAVILEMLTRDSSPPLFYFLLKGWMALFGDGPTAVRLPSTIFSLLLVAAVYFVGAREVSRRAGLWAAFIVAISPTQVFYSQQARMYSLLPLLAFAAWWTLVRYLRDGRPRDYWLSLLATAAALYTHNFAFYVPLVHVVLVLGSGQLFRRFGMWLLAAGLLSLVYAPWIPTLLTQLDNGDHYAWYVNRWESEGVFGSIANSMRSYAPSGANVMYARDRPMEWYGVPAAVVTGFAIWGSAVLFRRRGEFAQLTALWLVATCVVPIAASLALSSVLTPHYVPGRVDQMMLPSFALLTAVGLSSLRPEALQRIGVAVFLVVAIVGRGAFYSDFRRGGIAGAGEDLAAAVLAELREGDVVLCTSLTRAPVEYYLQRSGSDPPIISYPRSTAQHLGSQNHRRLLADEPGLLREARSAIERARTLAGPGGRLILLRTDVEVNRFLDQGPLASRFGVGQQARLGLYKLDGTKEYVWLTVNRLSEPEVGPTKASGAGD